MQEEIGNRELENCGIEESCLRGIVSSWNRVFVESWHGVVESGNRESDIGNFITFLNVHF